ncbi:MAG: SsrA-binding protein SmpB [Sphingobacteriales bacterium]|nr:SsrA-binding protein SmpB [Sphingobacteriales bacterium]
MKQLKLNNDIVANNKKADFQYFLVQTFKAGIVLTGTEVKSVRLARVNMSDAYCYFKKEELWLKNLHIAEYSFGNYANHAPLRERKLLLKNKELRRLQAKIKERGFTIIPVQMFISERGLVKIEIALAKGKKSFDKRDTIKDREAKKDVERMLKKYR